MHIYKESDQINVVQTTLPELPEFFPVQYCLGPLGQHYIGPRLHKPLALKGKSFYAKLSGASRTTLHRVLPVQCCPKSIKVKLHRIFHATLSGASRTILHRVLTCAILS